MTVTTPSGFVCEIEEDCFDDMEYLEALMEIKEDARNQALYMPKLITMMIGEEGKKALYEHCRDEKGKVRISTVSEEFEAIMNAAPASKKK